MLYCIEVYRFIMQNTINYIRNIINTANLSSAEYCELINQLLPFLENLNNKTLECDKNYDYIIDILEKYISDFDKLRNYTHKRFNKIDSARTANKNSNSINIIPSNENKKIINQIDIDAIRQEILKQKESKQMTIIEEYEEECDGDFNSKSNINSFENFVEKVHNITDRVENEKNVRDYIADYSNSKDNNCYNDYEVDDGIAIGREECNSQSSKSSNQEGSASTKDRCSFRKLGINDRNATPEALYQDGIKENKSDYIETKSAENENNTVNGNSQPEKQDSELKDIYDEINKNNELQAENKNQVAEYPTIKNYETNNIDRSNIYEDFAKSNVNSQPEKQEKKLIDTNKGSNELHQNSGIKKCEKTPIIVSNVDLNEDCDKKHLIVCSQEHEIINAGQSAEVSESYDKNILTQHELKGFIASQMDIFFDGENIFGIYEINISNANEVPNFHVHSKCHMIDVNKQYAKAVSDKSCKLLYKIDGKTVEIYKDLSLCKESLKLHKSEAKNFDEFLNEVV